MAGFDFSVLNPKFAKSSSQDYGFLVDQLSIRQNQLEADGKLSPGDYDLLIAEAQKISSHPGLSKEQRSNLLVKISEYQSNKKSSRQKDNNDIQRLNNEIKDDFTTTGMILGNNPSALLQARADALRAKLDRLNTSISDLDAAGNDPTNHLSEFNATLSEYNDVLQATEEAKNYTPSGKPTSNFVAYLVTNSSGEITDVQVGRVGSKTGYVETNGIYGGMQVYGKVNKKEDNKNVFLLGNDRFSAPDIMTPDPSNPLSMKASILVSESQKSGKNIKTSTANQFKDIDLTQVRTQSYIRDGGYAEGSNGFLYKKMPNGKYVKYTNTDKTKLGITDNDIIRLPRNMEAGIIPNVSETIDNYQPFQASLPTSLDVSQPATSTPVQISSTPRMSIPAVGAGTSRTPSPMSTSPKGALGYAESTINKAKGFLGGLFGK